MTKYFNIKRLCALLACMALLVAGLPKRASAQGELFTDGGLQYRVLTADSMTGTYTAELADNQSYIGQSLSLPATVEYDGHTYSVTSVGHSAFRDANLTGTLTLPDSVNIIKENAFRGTGITQLNLPDNESLNIGPHAFSGTQLTGELNIPAGVFYIREYAFLDCTKITSLKLNKHASKTGYLYIGIEAFSRTGLRGTLTIPDSVYSIGAKAFQNLSGLTKLELPERGLEQILSTAFARSGITGTVTIPSSVREIGSFAFQGVEGLTGLELPASGLKEIGASAFLGTNLQGSLTLPDTLKTIGTSAFNGCTGLTGTLVMPASMEKVESGAFRGCTGLEAIVFTGAQAPIVQDGAFDYIPAPICTPQTGTGYEQPGLPDAQPYPDGAARITSLHIGAVAGQIDEATKTINLQLPYGSSLVNVRPSIGFVGRSISPAPDVAQDFRQPVTYTVQPVQGSAVTYRVVVTVNPNPPVIAAAGVSIAPGAIQLESGGTHTLSASITPANATDKRLQWSTNNAAVATVDANGIVTAHSAGTARITVQTTSGGHTATCTVTVSAKQQPGSKPSPTPPVPSKVGWGKEGKHWVYYDKEGNRLTGWHKLSRQWYHFDNKGLMQTGWIKQGRSWYCLKSSGAMATGWHKAGAWYYFEKSGRMVTGWKGLKGKWYYLKSSGAMATGKQKIGSKTYTFNKSGVWVK